MSLPEVVLGAGASGLIVGYRLATMGRDFIILDRDHDSLERVRAGFFYLHQPLFGTERSFPVELDACPGGSPEAYAKKVYKDPLVGPVSIKPIPEKHTGYFLDVGPMLDLIGDRIISDVNIRWCHLGNRLVGTSDGRCWGFSRLHSTIPLPILSRLVDFPSKIEMNSTPIIIDTTSGPSHPDDVTMRTRYCAGDCHPWYRRTVHNGRTMDEYTGEPPRDPEGDMTLRQVRPGKIWLNPATKAEDERKLKGYRIALEEMGVYTWGRYGRWEPKHLTHMTWAESEEKLLKGRAD